MKTSRRLLQVLLICATLIVLTAVALSEALSSAAVSIDMKYNGPLYEGDQIQLTASASGVNGSYTITWQKKTGSESNNTVEWKKLSEGDSLVVVASKEVEGLVIRAVLKAENLEVISSSVTIPPVQVMPTAEPTPEPTAEPTLEPTAEPTVEPTPESTVEPTAEPTSEPTAEPTVEPTPEPTVEPTVEPTPEPTEEPVTVPTEEPTPEPKNELIVELTDEPTPEPTPEATEEPVIESTVEPTPEPTAEPTEEPENEPTEEPTPEPTVEPTEEPVVEPTEEPTPEPTTEPTEEPAAEPTPEPTVEPTDEPVIEEGTLSSGFVSIAGILPLEGQLNIIAGEGNISAPNGTVIVSYAITIMDANGDIWQPEAPVNITFTDEAFNDDQKLEVWREESGSREFVTEVIPDNGAITFTAERLSVYSVIASDTEPMENDPEIDTPVRRVTLHSTRGSSVECGQVITLTAELEGFSEEDQVLVIWEVNRGEGWEEAGTGLTYDYTATEESILWSFRARVLY